MKPGPDGGALSTHTHFFRGEEELDAAIAVLADRAASGRVPQVWSAGCSTGAEPYTLAILCAERAIDAAIHATDINDEALAAARAALYPALALRHAPRRILDRHFERRGGDYVVSPEIARRVTFGRGDLRTDPLPCPPAEEEPGWDVVLCRNVLIYYDPGAAGAIVTRLASALRPDGVLIVGSPDALSFRPIESLLPAGPRAVASYVRAGTRHASRAAPGALCDLPAAGPVIASVEPTTPPAIDLAAVLEGACQKLAAHAWDEAEAALLHVERAAPLACEPALYLGVLRRKQGRFDEAFTHLRRAAFLAPGSWAAAYLLAGAWEQRGDRARARLELRRALDMLERAGASAAAPAGAVIAGIPFDPADVARACRQRLGV